MQPLDRTLRNKLERTVKEARDVAEAGAAAALEQLGVGDAAAPTFLSEADKDLRRRLRIHGRQLGDSLNGGKVQTMERLIEEVAYEHWHRMLFARFLAENNLLMYPDPTNPVAVTLDECEDLAKDEGAKNGWELASRFATKMLPQIFRPDSPVFELELPPERQQKLEALVSDLDNDVFLASDSLGWVYQFWQSKRKDEVNASEVKIGARELPAVTQLFTEPYMVAFLLDNSLGAWWAARRLSEADLKNAESEDELRSKASIPGVPLEYLRFVKREDGPWAQAAGTFDGWPEHLSELKTLDPCCGSGHFLVAALGMLAPMRMELEGLSARESIDKVLSENIHGLEIDQRCVELAAFALALTAWRFPNAGGYRRLSELSVACSGLSVGAAKEEWKALALDKHNLRLALDWMYEIFTDAPVLGSLLNPGRTDAAKVVGWEELSQTLELALSQEQSDEQHEAGVAAQGLAKAATLLAGKYQWVITNVPYLKRGNQSDALKNFCEKYYPDGKNDLATVFLERCLELCVNGGSVNIVLPQNWLFLTSYKKFREKLLKNDIWHLIARLGEGGFDSSAAAGAFVSMVMLGPREVNRLVANKFQNNTICGLDVSDFRTSTEKANKLFVTEIAQVKQADQLNNPDARFSTSENNFEELIGKHAMTAAGFSTFDRPRFIFNFWEINGFNDGWKYCQSTVDDIKHFGGCDLAFLWENGEGQLFQLIEDKRIYEGYTSGIWRAGFQFWGSKGVLVSLMRELPATIYSGAPFDQNTALLVPRSPDMLTALWAYCSSDEFNDAVRKVDQSIKVTTATLEKIPIDWARWAKVAEEKYPNGLPNPYSDDPTQWIFHGRPETSDEPLQVAVARLLRYRWPAELDSEIDLSDQARNLVTESEKLLPFSDHDGIVCIPAIRGEMKAEDRLENLLAAAYGSDWSANKRSELLANADHAGKSMETWLREKFFTQHCKLFQNRPFIWHIWDGLRDGFAALVNYHKLDYKNLETLIYTYLGDWISRQKQEIAAGVDGAQEKLAAAESLKKKLELILHGEAPYDIFVRWKTIEKQPVGWNPDINDGVRLNIRPFLTVPDVGKRGAGVLRDKPNIKWDKDRGKDVESAPWYRLGLQYGGKEGDRINDHHLTLEEKKAAKEGF